MKKIFCLFLIVIIFSLSITSAFAEEDITELYRIELEYYRTIRNVPTAYEAAAWGEYNKLGKSLPNMKADELSEKDITKLQKIAAARAKLVQIHPVEDCILYIWGENMPIAEDVSELVFDDTSFDNENFRPFLLPYLVEDQSAAKGNIIIIAGGGYTQRANDSEGYAVAECFRDLDYNCFVLQRRVFPYSKEDIYMDLQRSLRFLRHHAADLGIGAADRMEAIGFSGGSGTVIGTIAHCYGNILPTVYDPSYIPDEIDEENSDFDAICAMYGPNADFSPEYTGLETENENLPEIFIAAGQLDYADAGKDSLTLAASVFDKTKVELHLFSDTRHGFSLGIGNNNSAYWIPMADAFFGRIGN